MSLSDIFSMLGGIGLFLLGMSVMSTGLRNACGNNLAGILEKATKNKLIAILSEPASPFLYKARPPRT